MATAVNGTLVIDIVDDVPTARADVDSVAEDAFVDGEGNPVADGNVITGALAALMPMAPTAQPTPKVPMAPR